MAVVWKRLTTRVICQVAYGFDDDDKVVKLGGEHKIMMGLADVPEMHSLWCLISLGGDW